MNAHGALVGYARTSTTEQVAGLEAQTRDLKAAGCRKVFVEQVSSVARRDQLDAALDYLREGDTLVVCKLDRLARNSRHLWELVEGLDARGIALRILTFGDGMIDTRGATGRLVLNMFSAVAQWERETMLERQREGIMKAKTLGKYKGRKPTARVKAAQVLKLRAAGKTVSAIARELKIGRASVYRAIAAAA